FGRLRTYDQPQHRSCFTIREKEAVITRLKNLAADDNRRARAALLYLQGVDGDRPAAQSVPSLPHELRADPRIEDLIQHAAAFAVGSDTALQLSLCRRWLFVHRKEPVLLAPIEIGELLLDGVLKFPTLAGAAVIHAAASFLRAEKIGKALVVLERPAAGL